MDTVVRKFRTALSGFNRRDVLDYIAQTASAHRQETAELERRLEETEQERDALRETLTGLEDEKGSAAAEEARVRACLEESTASLARLRAELSRTEAQLSAERAELSALEARMTQVAPMAQSYEELKDRVATVELDAHRKAQATVDEAQAQAAALRSETARWLDDVLAQYGALRTAMDAMVSAAREAAAQGDALSLSDAGAAALKARAAGPVPTEGQE